MKAVDAPRRQGPLVALLAANAISMSGNVATLVAIPWFVLQTTGSAARTGIVAAVGLVPIVVSGFVGGALVDRMGYRRSSVVADLASSAAVAAIPLLHLTVGIEFWQLVVLVFLGGLLDAPGVTARASLLPDVAADAGWSLERASGAAAVVERASRLVGAPLAGVLIALVGATSVLWIDATSFLVSALLVVLGVPRRSRAAVPGERSGYVEELREGFAFLHADRTLFALVAVLTLTNLLDSVSMVALPVYAQQVYGSAVSLGLMMAVVGAGSVVGALAFSAFGDRVSRRRVFTWGFAGVTLWYPVAAVFPSLGVLLTAQSAAGVSSGPLNPVIDTVFFERVPDGMRGRVFGVVQASAWLAMPIGVLVAGPAIEAFGLRPTLLVTGALYAGVVVAAMFLPALRGMDERRTAAETTDTANGREIVAATHSG
ncbi:MAG TPA: MFS transporter [Actinomycetota bacterium]|nr:MFS transporter [Actinomycetota bacterium]